MSSVSSSRIKDTRVPKCARCRNHGLVAPLKGHAGKCSFAKCRCWKCSLISERTRINAKQRTLDNHPEPTQSEPSPNLKVPADQIPDGTSATTSATQSRPQEMDGGGKTYIQLEAPVSGGNTPAEPTPPAVTETPIIYPHWQRGPQEPLLSAQPAPPWPGFESLVHQNPLNESAPMVPPFQLHAHYANTFMYPAFLVPAPPLGFPHPPEMRPQQEGPALVYAPQPRYPWTREESRPTLDQIPYYMRGTESPPPPPPPPSEPE